MIVATVYPFASISLTMLSWNNYSFFFPRQLDRVIGIIFIDGYCEMD